MRISCHLTFDGQCENAFRAYQSILGGELTTLLTFGDSALAAQVPESWATKILHATLSLEGQELLGSDAFPNEAAGHQGFAITLSLSDPLRAQNAFAQLADQGHIKMPLQPTFWAALFGVVIDRFGVTWEINCGQPDGHLPRAHESDRDADAVSPPTLGT
ncbi:VOC family protein [Ideonella margarita]|uniref:VOC family protein n=1 Tax=Ideonella margarita TaxID=2984191 RepID=A0ABU9C6E0_9BURK